MTGAGVLRRFGAMLYDTLLLALAVLPITTAIFLLFTHEAITPGGSGVVERIYQAALVLVIVLFFGVFWTWSGQTVGMLAWRLRVERNDGSLLTWRDALLRLGGACVSLAALGLGYFWIWIDRDRLAWHDRWSGTRVVVVPKRK
ncbi:MAG TPA: RDD family protein [Steroidobacteraceae bacterium]|jgi:Predicted membrane protein/domain|nr:RDD family protein [Steroidobacteraceae bacterium]